MQLNKVKWKHRVCPVRKRHCCINYVKRTFFVDFSPFRWKYYLLYQSFPPNLRMGLTVISQRYTVSKDFETIVLQQLNCRMCNQSILNYLLIELSRDKDLVKFWDTVNTMIQFPELKDLMEIYRLEHGVCVCMCVCVFMCVCMRVCVCMRAPV